MNTRSGDGGVGAGQRKGSPPEKVKQACHGRSVCVSKSLRKCRVRRSTLLDIIKRKVVGLLILEHPRPTAIRYATHLRNATNKPVEMSHYVDVFLGIYRLRRSPMPRFMALEMLVPVSCLAVCPGRCQVPRASDWHEMEIIDGILAPLTALEMTIYQQVIVVVVMVPDTLPEDVQHLSTRTD